MEHLVNYFPNSERIIFIDENLYIKKSKALARYCRKSYKDLIFNVVPQLRKSGKKDGVYETEIATDNLFEKVYGKIILKFSVQNDITIIEDIEPNDILIDCYMKHLPVYKGVPYSTKKDLFKIKTMEEICAKNTECQTGK